MVSYIIRSGRVDDCEDVVRLMQKLSAHEGFADQSKISAEGKSIQARPIKLDY